MKEYRGRTEDAEAPFLSADFWEVGTSIHGVVTKVFETTFGDGKKGRSYVLDLESPVTVNGVETERVSVGNMAGFIMAMQAAGLQYLSVKGILGLQCTGKTQPKKEGHSPRVNFSLHYVQP